MTTLQISAIALLEDPIEMEAFLLFIRQCEAIADEIIVVSLIPLKNMQKELEQWGVKWIDSEGLCKSEALNRGLDLAKGIWILRLDATETLDTQEIYRLQMLANRFEEECFYFPIPDLLEMKYTVPYETRLFRNRAGYRYRGHFVCCLPLELENKTKLVSVPLFQPTERECKSSDADIVKTIDENIFLLDSMERLYWSVKLANQGLLTEAKRIWEELRMEECLPLRYEGLLYQWIAQALEENGRAKEALDCINVGLKKHPHAVNLHLIKGHLLYLLDEWDAAEELLRYCIQSASLSDEYVPETKTIQGKAWYTLAKISEAKGQIDKAMTYYEKSCECNRNNTVPLFEIARLVHRRDGEEKLLALLDQRIDEQDGKRLLLRANILYSERLYKEARDTAESVWREWLNQRDAAMMVIANSALMMGKPKDAILSFAKIPEQSLLYVPALLRTCLTYWLLSDWHKAKECLALLPSRCSPLVGIYLAIHHLLSGEQETAIDEGEQVFDEAEEEFKNIIRCFLDLNRMDLIESLFPLFKNNRYMYPAVGELFYEYRQYSYADRFALNVLEHDPEQEKMGLLFFQSKKEQKKEYEAAQWLSRHLGESVAAPNKYMQYVGIIWDWSLTITGMGIRDYPQDESLKRLYQAVKELQLG